MRQYPLYTVIVLSIILLCIPLPIISQSSEIIIDAGESQFINWDKTHTAQLEGSVSSAATKIEWTCPANSDVKFADISNPKTKVTFPRPGYYLLQITAKWADSKKVIDTVLMNVFKPKSYKNRLKDLIGLMTVEEKISQLSNQSDAIPRLNIERYNYWSEALHGVLDRGTTSFPQVVALGASWDPDLVHRVATAISDEARIKNKIEGKGLSYWSPTVNIARDPRWGRNEESYSEDPYLLSRMGVAFVT